MQIFDLKAVTVVGNKASDGSYKTYEYSLGIFDCVSAAELFLHIHIAEEQKNNPRFFGFFLYEKTLNGGLHEDWGKLCYYQSVWSYLPDGTLYCYSPYDTTCKKPFRGRPAETIPLPVGELAWWWDGSRICPCVVEILPLTDVEYAKRAESLGGDCGYDFTDDCYLVDMYPRTHNHPATWALFPYFGTLSKRNLDRIRWHDRGLPEN